MVRKITPQGTDDINFDLISDFGGYNSSIDPTNAPKNILVRGSQNVYKKLSGTIANRFGLKRRGAADATVAGVTSEKVWNNSSAQDLPLRVCNGKLQVESDIVTSGTYVWYDLLTGLTTTAWSFDSWWNNTLHFDVLLFVGGTTTLYNWTGGMAKILSTTSNTIVFDRTIAASRVTAASGTIKVNGNSYTYSGSSGSTLTGVSGDPTGEANGSVVIEAVNSNATTPAATFTNDFIRVIGNSLYVGSYTSQLIYKSKKSSYTDFTFSTPRVVDDGDLITLDNCAKGIGIKNGHAWIGAGTSDWYEVSYSQLTTGTVLTELPKIDKKPTSLLSAPLGHEFIDMAGADMMCLTQDHQVIVVGEFRNQFQTKYPTISLQVKTEFNETDFTGGHLRCIGNIVYITAPLSGTDYMHETRENIDVLGNINTVRFWHPPQIRGISRFTAISGTVYGYSVANPQTYQIWDTNQYYDDSPSGGQLPYNSIMLMAYRDGGLRQGKISFEKLFVEGYATENSQLNSSVYYNYQGAETLLSEPINTKDNLFTPFGVFTGSVPPSLGDASLGDNPLGSGVVTQANDQALVPKFKQIIGYTSTDCFEYAVMIWSQTVNDRWEILALGTNAHLSSTEATEIVK